MAEPIENISQPIENYWQGMKKRYPDADINAMRANLDKNWGLDLHELHRRTLMNTGVTSGLDNPYAVFGGEVEQAAQLQDILYETGRLQAEAQRKVNERKVNSPNNAYNLYERYKPKYIDINTLKPSQQSNDDMAPNRDRYIPMG